MRSGVGVTIINAVGVIVGVALGTDVALGGTGYALLLDAGAVSVTASMMPYTMIAITMYTQILFIRMLLVAQCALLP